MGSCSENLVVGSDLLILLLQLGDKCTGKNDGKFCQCCCPSQVSSGSEHAAGWNPVSDILMDRSPEGQTFLWPLFTHKDDRSLFSGPLFNHEVDRIYLQNCAQARELVSIHSPTHKEKELLFTGHWRCASILAHDKNVQSSISRFVTWPMGQMRQTIVTC